MLYMTVVDLFAGAGGWDIGARTLGLDPVGIDVAPDVCATRRAAGLRTIQADLSQHIGSPPAELAADVADLFQPWPSIDLTAGLDGLIASPPCPAFSVAGQGSGRAELDDLIDAAHHHHYPSPSASTAAQLLWLPIQWATTLAPTWVAIEQVPPVLRFFEAAADMLAYFGFYTWAGIVNAADYGVPQNRRRAVLLAHRHRPIEPPPPDHPAPCTMGQALGLADGRRLIPGTFARNGGHRRFYGLDEPAPTIAFGHDMAAWEWLQRDGSLSPLTETEAATLQTFPPDWPWAGTKRTRSLQIANAVPPLLAAALLDTLQRT